MFLRKKTKIIKLEPEEILFDSEQRKKGMEFGLERPLGKWRFGILAFLFFSGLLLVLGRSFYLQIVKGDFYAKLAEDNRSRLFAVEAPRGIIYDKNGQALVENISVFDLVASPININDQDLGKLAPLADFLETDLTAVQEKIQQSADYYLLLQAGISQDDLGRVEDLIKDLPGFFLQERINRFYPWQDKIAHVIGYTGGVSEPEQKVYAGLLSQDKIGKAGLELFYEDYLRGQYGFQELGVDSLGRINQIFEKQKPEPGDKLLTSLDLGLQLKLYQALTDGLVQAGAEKGAGIVLNPQTGQIMALASLPSFDPNYFVNKDNAQIENIFADELYPLFNRAVSGQYPPGSTIKPFIASAALQESIISQDFAIDCHGGITVNSKYDPSVEYFFADFKPHGRVNLKTAIAKSCNSFFYIIGGGYQDFRGLGAAKIEKYLSLFGFGDLTGIDLPQENKGLIPNEKWKIAAKKEIWYIGDTYHLSIGQGDLNVTPLQLALATAAIANNGKLFQPQIVEKITDNNDQVIKNLSPVLLKNAFIDSDKLALIKQAMAETAKTGTAWRLADLSVAAAAKTGTAQFGIEDKTHALFTGFAPVDNPEIVVTIIMEGAGYGESQAVPVAKDVLKWYFK